MRGLVEDVVYGATLPWKTVMSALAMLFTFAGSNARNTGLKPPINASRSKAGDVRDNGMSPPGGSRSLAPALTPFELHVPVTDQVGIADLGGRGLIQRHRTIDIELHPNPTATVDQV